MVAPSVLERVSSPIGDILPPSEKYTFLAGAGISMDPPSSIPSAREFVRALLEYCAPASEIDALISLKPLRYELMVEKVKEILDPNLHFLDYFETIKEPNANHLFLATAIVKGNHNVITTNFDESIERATERLLEPGQKELIVPVITRKDFVKLARPLDLFKAGKYPLYKIHGAKRNAITGEGTAESIVTTISALGKDRGIGETFALESYKKQAIYNLVKNRVLVVLGYSGSDDFDIGPTLQGMRYLKRLVWIDYAPVEGAEIYKVKANAKPSDLASSSQVERVLAGIASRGNVDVYLVKARTGDFVKSTAWPLLYPGTTGILSTMAGPATKPVGFKDWFFTEFKDKKVSELERRVFACCVFGDLGEFDACTRNATAGLALALEAANPGWQAFFLNQLTRVALAHGDIDSASHYADSAVAAVAKTSHPVKQGIATCNSGLVAIRRDKGKPSPRVLQEAKKQYTEALHLFESGQDEWGKVACLNNLAEVDAWEGDLDAATKKLMECSLITMRLGNLEFKATLATNIGWILAGWDDKTDAVKQLLDARDVRKELGDAVGVARVANRLASVYIEEGRLEDATRELDLARDSVAGRKDEILEVRILENASWLNFRAGNLGSGAETCKQALAQHRTSKDKLGQALDLGLLACIAWLEGRNADAAANLEEASGLYTEQGFMLQAAEDGLVANQLRSVAQGKDAPTFNVEKWLAMLPDEIKSITDPAGRATAALQKVIDSPKKLARETKIATALLAGIALHVAKRNREALECWAAGFSVYDLVIADPSYKPTPGKSFPAVKLREALAHAGIVLLPRRRMRVDLDPIYRDDTDISPSHQIEWMPATDNRATFKAGIQLVESAKVAMDGGEYERASQELEKAQQMLEGIHRDDMTEVVDSLLFEANLKLGRADGSPQGILARAVTKVAFYSERATKAADTGNKKAVVTAVEDAITYMDILGMVNPEFKAQAEQARQQVARIKEDLAKAEESEEQAKKDVASLDQTDIISAVEYLLNNPDTMEADHDPEANLESEHADDEAYWELLGKLKSMMMLTKAMGNIQMMAEGCYNLGELHASRKEYKAALARFNMAFRQALLTGESRVEAMSIAGIGSVLFAQDKNDDALDKYEFALRLYDDIGPSMTDHKALALSRIGMIYELRGDREMALERLGELVSLPIPDEKIVLKADALARIGIMEKGLGQTDQAYEHLSNASNLFSDIKGNEQLKTAVWQQLAILELGDGFVEFAIADLEEALEILKTNGLAPDIALVERNIATLKARLGDPACIIDDQSKRAMSLAKAGHFKDAVDAIELALLTAQENNKKDALPGLIAAKATIHEVAGDAQAESGDFLAAKESYATAIDTLKKTSDQKTHDAVSAKLEAAVSRLEDPAVAIPLLEARAKACLDDRKNDEGLEAIDAALALRAKGSNLPGKGSALFTKAKLLHDARQLDDARDAYSIAFRQLEDEGNKGDLIDALYNASVLGPSVQPAAEAMHMLERASGLAREIKNDHGLATILGRLGTIYMESKKFDQARDTLEEARRIFETLKNEQMQATVLLSLGDLDHARGDNAAALDRYDHGLRMFEKLGKLAEKASALNKIGIVHETMANYRMALETYKASMEAATQMNDELMLAACTFNAGDDFRMNGDIETAAKYMNDAKAIAEKHGVLQYLAPFLAGLAYVDMASGQYQLATGKIERSRAISERLGDWEGILTAENELAEVHVLQGNLTQAEVALRAALAHPELARDAAKKINPISNLAIVEFLQGNVKQAIDHLLEALDLARATKEKCKAARCCERLARLAWQNKNQTDEKKWLDEACRLYVEMGLDERAKIATYTMDNLLASIW